MCTDFDGTSRLLRAVAFGLAAGLTAPSALAAGEGRDAAPAGATSVATAPQSAPLPPVERTWYGWQVWTADGTAAVLAATGVALLDHERGVGAAFATTGLVTFLLAPPIIHAFHGRGGVGWGSLSLRIGVPTTFMVIGAAASSCTGTSRCDQTSFVLAAATGLVLASLVDGLAFSYDNPARARAKEPEWFPLVAAEPRGARLGVAGFF